MSDYKWDIRNIYEMLIKDSAIATKQKHAKDCETNQTRLGASWTSVAANEKDGLYRGPLYHRSCDIAGYKKFPLIWKVRECAVWDDESKIVMIGPLVAEEQPRVLCVPLYWTSLTGGCALARFVLEIRNLTKQGCGRLFKHRHFLGILWYVCIFLCCQAPVPTMCIIPFPPQVLEESHIFK